MDINQVWPEWHEECVLGEGSFGKVYRAKRVEYGRTFYSAIKVLTVPKSQQEVKYARSQGMNDNEVYQYFRGLVDNLLNEITLMDNLKGANNIVGIEDYKIIEREGEIGWDIFIRMELLSPFDSFISNPEFSQVDVLKLGVDICSALEVCEQNNIVHRDIKPDNIFISRFGEYKLGDFGIAKKLEATQANLSRKGTLNYMAPEVYRSEPYGSNVDIYSLGLVLYTLLNNNRVAFLPPYPQQISYKDNEDALAMRLSGAPVTPPCNANPSLGAVIAKACSYLPQDRYQTATEFKNALIAEWNMLVQYGNAPAGTPQGQIDPDSTLVENDMPQPNNYPQTGNYPQQDQGEDVSLPDAYSTAKSNKICRVLSWPLAVALCVLGGIMLPVGGVVQWTGISMLAIGVTLLLADHNRFSVGAGAIALSLPYLLEGLDGFLAGISGSFPISSVVVLLSGALMLFGGFVILTQREVRFGGSLCLYALVAEWLFQIYGLLNQGASLELMHIYWSIAAFTLFMWSYGYNSDEQPQGFKKVLYFAAFLPAVAAVVVSVVRVLELIPAIFA